MSRMERLGRDWLAGLSIWADAMKRTRCEIYMCRLIDVYVMLYDCAIQIYRGATTASITRPLPPSPLAATNQHRLHDFSGKRTHHSRKVIIPVILFFGSIVNFLSRFLGGWFVRVVSPRSFICELVRLRDPFVTTRCFEQERFRSLLRWRWYPSISSLVCRTEWRRDIPIRRRIFKCFQR